MAYGDFRHTDGWRSVEMPPGDSAPKALEMIKETLEREEQQPHSIPSAYFSNLNQKLAKTERRLRDALSEIQRLKKKEEKQITDPVADRISEILEKDSPDLQAAKKRGMAARIMPDIAHALVENKTAERIKDIMFPDKETWGEDVMAPVVLSLEEWNKSWFDRKWESEFGPWYTESGVVSSEAWEMLKSFKSWSPDTAVGGLGPGDGIYEETWKRCVTDLIADKTLDRFLGTGNEMRVVVNGIARYIPRRTILAYIESRRDTAYPRSVNRPPEPQG